MDKCRPDKCCLVKCHSDRLNPFKIVPETYLLNLAKIGSVTAEILLTLNFCGGGGGGGMQVIFVSHPITFEVVF